MQKNEDHVVININTFYPYSQPYSQLYSTPYSLPSSPPLSPPYSQSSSSPSSPPLSLPSSPTESLSFTDTLPNKPSKLYDIPNIKYNKPNCNSLANRRKLSSRPNYFEKKTDIILDKNNDEFCVTIGDDDEFEFQDENYQYKNQSKLSKYSKIIRNIGNKQIDNTEYLNV